MKRLLWKTFRILKMSRTPKSRSSKMSWAKVCCWKSSKTKTTTTFSPPCQSKTSQSPPWTWTKMTWTAATTWPTRSSLRFRSQRSPERVESWLNNILTWTKRKTRKTSSQRNHRELLGNLSSMATVLLITIRLIVWESRLNRNDPLIIQMCKMLWSTCPGTCSSRRHRPQTISTTSKKLATPHRLNWTWNKKPISKRLWRAWKTWAKTHTTLL